MRILHIIKNFDFGGAENYVRDLSNSLNCSGDDIFIIARPGRQAERLDAGVCFIPMYIADILLPANIIAICRIIIKYRIDLIHAHQRLSVLEACLAGRILGIPVVVTVHGRTRLDLRYKISRKTPSRIIFVSKSVLEVSAKYNEIAEKSVIIPNWISFSGIKSDSKPFFVSYISRLDREHTAMIIMIIRSVICRIAEKYSEFTFNVIGDGKTLNKIREEARKVNSRLGREVCFIHGYAREVTKVIRISDLVIGVGRVAIEAMQCGVPVLSMNNKRMGSIISPSNYEWYKVNNFVAVGHDAPDENSLFFQLTGFFSNPTDRIKDAAVLQNYVSREFNLEYISREIRKIYGEVAVHTNNKEKSFLKIRP